MKTIAFAGEHSTFIAVVEKLIGTKPFLNVAHRTLQSGEQVKILISQNPYDPQPNRYKWASGAEQIFVCVDANDLDFMSHLENLIKVGWYNKDEITVVGHANELDLNILEKFQTFACDHGYPMIYCSIKNNVGYYTSDNNTFYEEFNAIFDKAINKFELESLAVEAPQHEHEHEHEHERKRDRFKRLFKK